MSPDGERVRLFVALELPDDVRSALASWRDAALVPALRPVPAASLHVTLCFLGARLAGEVAAIGDACAESVMGSTTLSLAVGSVAWLPRRRPNVLSVGLSDESGALARVQAGLAAALVTGGWCRTETRPFFAHVTVARVRRGERMRAVALAGPPALSFPGSRVTLFRSHPGSQYEPLWTGALSGGH